jgi:iron complex outermembrane receptor protein
MINNLIVQGGNMFKKISTRCLSVTALVGCSMMSGFSFAESSVAERFMEEIVVRAEKKESTLQSTPLAITAIGEEEIEKRGIKTMHDVQYLAPGVSFNQTGPTGFITMRGVGVEFTTIMAEPGVSLHSDGVYKGGSMSSTIAMFDLETIEVVRGPQGTLNGRNSTGGSVNIYSRLPGDEASFEAGLMIGDYDRVRYEVSGDIPVSDDFKIRLAGARDERDGYIENTNLNRDEAGEDYSILKATAVWTPTEDLEVIVRGDLFDSEQTGPVYLFTTLVSGPCCDFFGGLVTPTTSPWRSTGETPNDQDVEVKGYSLTVNYQLNDSILLRSITSYATQDLEATRDIDGTSVPFLDSYRSEDMDEFSQEFTLLGMTGKLDWIVGAYYYDSESNYLGEFNFPAITDTFKAIYGGAFGLPGPLPSLEGLANRVEPNSGRNDPDLAFLDDGIYEETQSKAIYAQGTYSFSDTLRATVGIRNTQDEKTFIQSSTDNLFTGDTCIRQESKDDWSETTGKIGIDADLSNGWLVYGTVSSGYRSGGFDYGSCFDPFDPESLMSYEAGLKMDLSATLRVNLAAFVYDYEDYQARLFTPLGTETLNADGADIQGLEVEFDWLASERLRLSGSVSYLNTEFKSLAAQDPMAPENGFVELKGNHLLRAPELQADLTVAYDIRLDAGLLTLQGEFSYMDEQHHSLWNTDIGLEPSRTMQNYRVYFEPAAFENISISAFVNNASDDEYHVMVLNSGLVGGTTTAYGAPRTWGVQFRYKR